MVNSCDPDAPTPKVGSRWVWEIDLPHARALLEVTDVFWNGEEWWIETKSLLSSDVFPTKEFVYNELGRFWEAVTPVGGTVGSMIDRQIG